MVINNSSIQGLKFNIISSKKCRVIFNFCGSNNFTKRKKSMIHHHNIVLVNHRKVDSTFHRSGNSYRNPILNDQIRQCQIARPRY